VILLVSSPYGFAAAWQHSRTFWQQTFAATVHHLPVLLAVAVVPAALRAYFILKDHPIRRWELNLTEALLTVFRILICVVAIWVTLTPREWQTFKLRLRDTDQLQFAMQRLGAYLGRALHLLIWEVLFFVVAFWLLHVILSLVADRLTRQGNPDRRALRYRALGSVLRNLILGPLALIYLVAFARTAFS
jgi:hypothetical protein